ncbi:MAG: hypothetical protein QOH69_3061, partial [Actinomycetota bacterium]|nr:hypothetical protein [Actinomycetota bacterium]
VTLTPEVLVNGGQFNGWDNDVVGAGAPAGGTGDVTRYVRTIVVTSNILTTAGFYLASACSRLTLLGDQGLVSFDNTGCGPGYYADLQKQVAINDGVEPSTLWQDKYHTPITANLNRVQKLDLYASVRGDVRSCFGTIPSTSGPSPDGTGWKTYGPLQGDAPSCNIAGTASIWTQACQTVVTTPSITVDGDATAATYDASSLPGTLYLVGADGVVSDYATSDFRWAQLIPIDRSSNGKLSVTDVPPGPCHDTPGAFPADTDLLLGAAAPSNGFAFDGWTGRRESGLYTVNPIEQVTDDTQRSLTNTAHYTVSCHTVTLGEGISIVGDAPRCPGSSAADKSYIADVAIQVKAIQHIGNRIITKFNGSVIADQITKDPASGDLTGFVVIDGDQNVSATYLTNGQYLGIGIAKGLKTVLGVAAVAAPILLGAVFPPAGILFAVLGAGAGIANLIPGGGKVAAVFELLNPTAMTTCIARWSFNNAGDPTGGKNIGAIGKTVKTLGKEGKSLYDGGPDVDSIVAGAADDIKLGEILGTVGSVAGFEYGLYSAGIMNVNVSNPQTVAEVNDTSTMTGCLDDQWKAAGANVG